MENINKNAESILLPITESSLIKNWKLKSSILYYICFIIFGSGMSCLGPLIPFRAVKANRPETDYSSLFTFRGLGYLFGSLLAGKADHLTTNENHLISLGVFIFGLVNLLIDMLNSLFLLNTIFFIQGIGMGFIDVICNSLILALHKDNYHSWMQALHFFFGVGASLTPYIIGITQESGLIYIGVFSIIVSFNVYFLKSPSEMMNIEDLIISENPEENSEDSKNWPECSLYVIVLVCLFFFFYPGVETGYGGWISTYSILVKVLDAESAANLSSIFWVFLTLGRLLGVLISVKYTGAQQLKFDQIGSIITLIISVILIKHDYIYYAIYFCSIFLGFFISTIFPLGLGIPHDLKYKANHDTTSKFIISAAIGEMVVPYIIGIIMDYLGPHYLFYSALFLCKLTSIIYYFTVKWFKSDDVKKNENLPPISLI